MGAAYKIYLGNIITGEEHAPYAQALVCEGSKIVFVGGKEESLR